MLILTLAVPAMLHIKNSDSVTGFQLQADFQLPPKASDCLQRPPIASNKASDCLQKSLQLPPKKPPIASKKAEKR